MAVTFTIKSNAEGLSVNLRNLRQQFPAGVAKGINKAVGRTGIAILSDEVGAVLNLNKGSIKSRFKILQRANASNLSAVLGGRESKRPNVTSFRGARMTGTLRKRKGTQVKVRFRLGSALEEIPAGYIKTVKGGRAAFTRYKSFGTRELYAGPRKGKFRSLEGPSVLGTLDGNPKVKDSALTRLAEAAEKRINEEVNFALIKHMRKAQVK